MVKQIMRAPLDDLIPDCPLGKHLSHFAGTGLLFAYAVINYY